MIAVVVEGANAYQSSPYPAFFTKQQLLTYDVFLGVVVVLGAASPRWSWLGAVDSRARDALGAALAGTILMVLGSALLFTRLIAVVRG